MARQLTNISGETRTLQDSHGRWHVVGPGEVYTVDAGDDRYFQTGAHGEPPLWEELPDRTTRKPKTTTTIEEAS